MNGRAEEGITLHINHPAAGHNIALVLGEHKYVLRDKFPRQGCIYTVTDDRPVVRRAWLGELRTNSGAVFPILRRLNEIEPSSFLVHVFYGMGEGVRLNHGVRPLWSGVVGGKIVSRDQDEALVALGKGEILSIFYPDGRVARFNGEHTLVWVTSAEALEMRLKIVERNSYYGELPKMIRMTKKYPDLRKQIIAFIDDKKPELSSEVCKDLKAALRAVGDPATYWWLAAGADEDEKVARTAPAVSVQKYDGRLHGLITEAVELGGEEWRWKLAFRALEVASEEGQLRPGVQKRFCTQCPPELSELSDKVGKLPVAEGERKSAASPLKNETTRSKREAEARRAANRQTRLDAQPRKGSSAEKPLHPKKGKDGKKK